MNFTSKSRYALKIVMDLAHHQHLPHVPRQEIAKRQGIPTDYLDQIMIRLRKGGLVESVRGRGGGYRLKRGADDIAVWDVFRVAEGNLDPVQCLSEPLACDFDTACISKSAWELIAAKMRAPLEGMYLSELVGADLARHKFCPVGGVRECRAPDKLAVGGGAH